MGHFSVEWVYGPWPHPSYNIVVLKLFFRGFRTWSNDVDEVNPTFCQMYKSQFVCLLWVGSQLDTSSLLTKWNQNKLEKPKGVTPTPVNINLWLEGKVIIPYFVFQKLWRNSTVQIVYLSRWPVLAELTWPWYRSAKLTWWVHSTILWPYI